MKLNKTWIFTGISSAALIVVLIIQVLWIFESARIKEQLFNEKVNLVLTKTRETLLKDTSTANNLKVYVDELTTHEADSVLQYYMNLYAVNVPYTFELVKYSSGPGLFPKISPSNQLQSANQTCLAEVPNSKDGFELNLRFPSKKMYLMAEMRTPFITSILLIIIVIILLWRTILAFKKEKSISDSTTEFLNNMTHEFKTPLTNIALAGKMLTKDSTTTDKEKISHYSSIILEENEKLKQQVEQVLSITALERGEIPIRKTSIDIHQMIKDAARHMNLQVENKGGEIQMDLKASKYVIDGDRWHLMNALYNLMDNAIKYNNNSPVIKIKTSDTSGLIRIEIEDNGPGIEKIFHEKIFDKYFRVPTGNVHNVKGFGLGLAYVKQVIILHGGSIHLRNSETNGCIFTIELPYA